MPLPLPLPVLPHSTQDARVPHVSILRHGNVHLSRSRLGRCFGLSSLLITHFLLLAHKAPLPYPNQPIPHLSRAPPRSCFRLCPSPRRPHQTPVITGESPPPNYFSLFYSAKSHVKPPNRAKAKRGAELIHPTHRKCAMDGAPERFWLVGENRQRQRQCSIGRGGVRSSLFWRGPGSGGRGPGGRWFGRSRRF